MTAAAPCDTLGASQKDVSPAELRHGNARARRKARHPGTFRTRRSGLAHLHGRNAFASATSPDR